MYLIKWFNTNKFKGVDRSKIKDDSKIIIKALMISSPFILYTAFAFQNDPYLQVWNKQSQLPSPHFVHYLVAYGAYLPFVVSGLIIITEEDARLGSFAAGWLLILPVLVSIPVSAQRRLAEGIWAIISVGTFGYIMNRKKAQRWIYGLVVVAIPSTLMIWVGSMMNLRFINSPIYRPKAEITMYRELQKISEIDSVVLSSYEIGNNLPAWVPVRVVFGQRPETVNWKETQQDVYMFYQTGMDDKVREQIINEYQIDYVVLSPLEKEMGGRDFGDSELLELVFNYDQYAIYETDESP
jgi:hypothetical protein